jgi:hypothetical protein
MTKMQSAWATDASRCATTTHVRFRFTTRSAATMLASVSASSAEVTSSQSMTAGCRSNVRAIATRCRSPPLSLAPRSPTLGFGFFFFKY